MSRIAGVHAADRAAARDQGERLVRALARPQDMQRRTTGAGRASLAWVGSRSPVVATSGALTVVVDGTFYNREELDSAWPHEMPAGNDAERLAACCLAVGLESALQQINGDFAVAVYDERADALWLARDRFGVKPLYYTLTLDRLAFCSRPGPLLALPGISSLVNRRFVAAFAGAHYRYIDNRPEESPFEAVRQVPARSWVRWQNGALATGRYWDLVEESDLELPEAELAARYRELLLDAVRRRVAVADRPAFALSGGLDSSSVLSCAVQALEQPQHAYSTVYSDRTYDESEEIRSMLATKVAEWHPVTVGSPDVLALVERMVAEHDEPVATATWLSHELLCERMAADGFKTLFGGLGGDELNAGEYEYFFYRFADLKAAGEEGALAAEIGRWAEHHDHPIYRKNRAIAEATVARVTDSATPGRCRPDTGRLTRYYAAVDPGYFDLRTFEPELDHPFRSYLKNRTYQDLFRETAPCCLRAEDRQTVAHRLDHVDPFFDHRLADLMFRVPGSMKIRDGVTKRLLRSAMAGILPEETRTRIKKTGWNAPAHAWFSVGRAAEQLGDLIASQAFRERGVYRIDEVSRLFAEHREIVSSGAASENHMMFLWQLVNLELWFRVVVDRYTASAAA
jgi:asparagine synthase (glutamine-hydrolysing)